jgi:hypothetical protein
MHYPRRKAVCLLLEKADKVSAKLYNNGKGNMLSIVATLEEF